MLDNNKDSGIYDLGSSVPISFEDVGLDKYKVPIEYIPFPEHLRGKTRVHWRRERTLNFRTVKSYVKNDFVS